MLAMLLAALLVAAPAQDTLVTKDGSRLTGTIVEESPTEGVTMRLDDGTLRRFDPDAIARIEGGTTGTQQESAPAGPSALAPQAGAAAPPQGRLDTVYLAGGGRVRGRVIEDFRARA